MPLGLGIDAGGTYTDAVILDFDTQQVLAKGKALTTRDELSVGIANVTAQLPGHLLQQVQLVALSTTLATNAIVEGKGSKVGALLLGFDAYDMARIAHEPKRAIGGKTDITGQVVEPLDEAAVRAAVVEMLEEGIAAVAVSGMVGVKNPALELRAAEIVRELTEMPIICGHALSMQLDTIARSMTAILNARLLPIIADLIAHVQDVMATVGVRAPLMVVRGDGTLMSEEMTRRHPVETVLSGPAASVCGAQILSGIRDGLVVDIGGTTSDIAVITNGQPRVAARGARVAEWTTQVRAVDIDTVGLGGDSAVALTRERKLTIGPRRAIPLAFLAHTYPEMLEELRRLWRTHETNSALVQPVECYVRLTAQVPPALAPSEERTLEALAHGPKTREQLARMIDATDPLLVPVARLETLGHIQRATLTPTDVLHYQGIFTAWNCEAAELAVRLFAHRADVEPDRLAEFVLETFSYWLALHLIHRVVRLERAIPDLPAGPADQALLDMLCDRTSIAGMTLHAQYAHPLVAIGAPAATLAQRAAETFGAQLIVPEHAEVANAVGAITGVFSLSVEANIEPSDEAYIVHSQVERRLFDDIEVAKAWAASHVRDLLDARLTAAGVTGFAIHRDVQVHDRHAASTMGSMFLECVVRATAVGRPEFVGDMVGVGE